jgi:hypothetical protein
MLVLDPDPDQRQSATGRPGLSIQSCERVIARPFEPEVKHFQSGSLAALAIEITMVSR